MSPSTAILILYRHALLWWAAALIAPFETAHDLVDDEIVRRGH